MSAAMSPQHSGCSSGTQLEKFLSFNLGMMSKPLKLRPRFTIRTATQTCNSGFYTCHAGQVSCNILYYRVNFRTAANCYNHGDRPHGTVTSYLGLLPRRTSFSRSLGRTSVKIGIHSASLLFSQAAYEALNQGTEPATV